MSAGPTMQLLGAIVGRAAEAAIDRVTTRAARKVKARMVTATKARAAAIVRAGLR